MTDIGAGYFNQPRKQFNKNEKSATSIAESKL
jgi:hypothetical protein